MAPPMAGPRLAPRLSLTKMGLSVVEDSFAYKGEAVKTIIGACSVFRANKSPTVPPATEEKADPARPVISLAKSKVPIFGATAQTARKTM